MSSVFTYVTGPVYAFLPRQLRDRVHQGSPDLLSRLTLLSGILEFAVAMVVMRAWYLRFFGILAASYSNYVSTTQEARVYTEDAVRQAGFAGFLFTPLTWIIFFFAAEGLFRTLVAASGEACGSFPLFVVARLLGIGGTRRSTAPELPLTGDEVTTGDAKCDLKISSSCRKPDWKYPYTIRYKGSFFQVISERHRLTGSRRYVYRLRRLPPGEIARGLRDYDPGT